MSQLNCVAYAELKMADGIDFEHLIELTDDSAFPSLRPEQNGTAAHEESTQEQDDEHEWTLLDSSGADDVMSLDSVMIWHRSFAEVAQQSVDDASDHHVPQPTLRHKVPNDRDTTADVSIKQDHSALDAEHDNMFDDVDIYLHRKTAGGGYVRQNRSFAKHQQERLAALARKESSQAAREERKRVEAPNTTEQLNKWYPTEEDLKKVERQYPRTFYISRTAWGNTSWAFEYRKNILTRSKREFYIMLWRAIQNDQHEFVQFLLRPNVYKAFWQGHKDSVSLSVTKQLAQFRERMARECQQNVDPQVTRMALAQHNNA
ncbi:hypothetical protein BCR43DRAFT_495122 [Syncephalastrum racemosum]|uniref:Uncharacterized protein n=1 Tax=Syncephalastrum racemosum TaxID=13706 RepID=A0A1X2H981_SYNRA|nr:hypothetical protein BCR43DRAFT_495122 [Syncephalastrum racemosum]